MLASVPLPSSYNLPGLSGVPSVLGQSVDTAGAAVASSFVGSFLVGLSVDAASALWGIYDTQSGEQMFVGASVIGVSYESEHRVSNAPIENGSFSSYNKTKNPYTIVVEYVCDGSRGLALADFVANVKNAEESLAIVSVSTPEISYASANIVGHRYRRSAERGLNLPVVEVLLAEVRIEASAGYGSAANPQGQPQQNVGTVQTQSPSATQSVAASDVQVGGVY